MSEETSVAGATEEPQVFADDQGRQYTVESFVLRSGEIAERFRGGDPIPFRIPAAGATVEDTIRNLGAFVHPEANVNDVLAALINGQGMRLNVQKRIKDILAPGDEQNARPAEDVLADARAAGQSFLMGVPRVRKSGPKAEGKLKAAQKTAEGAVNTALAMYRQLPRKVRAQYRDQLLALNTPGVTVEALDAIDAEA